MCDEREFISGIDATDADIDAYDQGELVEWRVAPDGTQWYRRVQPAASEHPDIRGEAEPVDDGTHELEAVELDDFERRLLENWADELRRQAADVDLGEGQGDAADE